MIAIGCDHGGFELKRQIIRFLEKGGYEWKDYGTQNASCSVDYPDYALAVAEAITREECTHGILICGTGLGISIAANKVPGIRAALCTDSFMARMSKEHNNANILVLGSRVVGEGLALEILDTWLKSGFTGDVRHQSRIDKISEIEEKYSKKT